MTSISMAMNELQNLSNAAHCHKDCCHEPCNVSLLGLKWTALRLQDLVWTTENEEAQKIIDEWPS